MIGVARAVDPFCLGFDCLQPVTEAMLEDAYARGFRYAGQYLNNLTPATRDLIFAHDLGILLYTEALVGEPLTVESGYRYGEEMVMAAHALDVAPTVHVAIDLEDPAAGSDATAHVNAMAAEMTNAGDLGAALYVGVPQPLTSAALFALRPNRYIKGGGRIVDAAGALAEPTCGWAAIQLEPLDMYELGGVKVDVEITKLDYKGRALTLWWPR